MLFGKREQAWRSLRSVQDGVLNRVTIFRAVPLNQPRTVVMLFGDLSCQSAVVIVWSLVRWSLRNRRADMLISANGGRLTVMAGIVGATIKCFACLACVDVAVVRGLNNQVNCHVVKLEGCMLPPECSERQFVCRLDPQDGESVWNLNIVGDILKVQDGSTQPPGRLLRTRNRRMQLLAFFNLWGIRSPQGKVAEEASAPSGS